MLNQLRTTNSRFLLSDLRDKSDAVDNMNKAKALLDATTVRVIQMVPWSKSIKMFQNRLQGPTKLCSHIVSDGIYS